MNKHITEETHGPVRLLRIDRAEAMNALTREMLEGLREGIARAGKDETIRAILLVSTGRAFSVGADLNDPMMGFDLPPEKRADACRETLGGLMNGLIRDIASCPVPVVTAVNGICAGGGYAVHTARTDHRIRAVGTVVAGNMGDSWRSEAFAPDGPAAALDRLAVDRTREARTDELDRLNWLPDTLDDAAAAGITDIDNVQAIGYYRTPRGGHPRSTNRRLARSDALLLGYDAFHLVDTLLTQPLQVILAGRRGVTGSYEAGMKLWQLAPNPVDLMIVEGAGHYEMYDIPEYVDQAVDRLADFYHAHLPAR